MNRTPRLTPSPEHSSRGPLPTVAGVALLVATFAGATAFAAEGGAAASAAAGGTTETQTPGLPAAAENAGANAAAGGRRAPRNADPFERVNRATFAFNDALDRMVARPAARLYRAVVPERGRIAVTNVVSNFEYPTTALNSALQGKFKDAGQGVARFVVNSTVGIGGLFDPATKFGLPRHDEDFGQTLGAWGVPSGPYLVLPGFGPANLRDGPARFVDRYTNARHYIGDGSTEWALLAVDLVDTRAQLLQADAALQSAFDPYALVRNAYLQRREYLVRDGQVPEEDYDDFYDEPLEDEPADEATAPGNDASGGTAEAGTASTPNENEAAPGTGERPAAPDAAASPQPAATPPGA